MAFAFGLYYQLNDDLDDMNDKWSLAFILAVPLLACLLHRSLNLACHYNVGWPQARVGKLSAIYPTKTVPQSL